MGDKRVTLKVAEHASGQSRAQLSCLQQGVGNVLQGLLEKQLRIMATFGIVIDRRLTVFMKHLQAATIGVVVEGAEVAAELNRVTRPWKPKDFSLIEPHLIEESVDVFFYLLEMWNMLGLDACDINNLYETKMYVNLRRVLSAVSFDERKLAVNGTAAYINGWTPDVNLIIAFAHAKTLAITNYDYKLAASNPIFSAAYLLLEHIGTNPETLKKLIANPLDETP